MARRQDLDYLRPRAGFPHQQQLAVRSCHAPRAALGFKGQLSTAHRHLPCINNPLFTAFLPRRPDSVHPDLHLPTTKSPCVPMNFGSSTVAPSISTWQSGSMRKRFYGQAALARPLITASFVATVEPTGFVLCSRPNALTPPVAGARSQQAQVSPRCEFGSASNREDGECAKVPR